MIKKTVLIILCMLVFCFQAEAFGDTIRHSNGLLISTGMSKGELIKKFGPPDNQTTSQDISGGVREEWLYADGKDIITVVIRNGRVVRVRKD